MSNQTTPRNDACCEPRNAGRNGLTYTPRVDIVEYPDHYALQAEVPGATADTIDIDLHNGRLHVAARVAPRQVGGERFVRREFGIGDFARSFEVGDGIDVAGIQATVNSGVLTINLPKAAALRARRVQVTSA